MKKWFTVLAAATAAMALACINDRDTIEFEARRFPNVLEISTGRFERNPAKYYEMRIERIDKQGGPQTLNEFDDKAAALGRLGRDAEAIVVMQAKGAKMREKGSGATDMDRYRYHANLGTFQAHKWLAEGGKVERIDELKEGIKNIERSIELNPDAHFGREEVQLNMMKWMVEIKTKKSKAPFAEWMAKENTLETKKLVEGLLGLVVLGSAWESPDVFHAVSMLVLGDELFEIPLLRVEELEKSGKKSPTGRSLAMKVSHASAARRKLFEKWRDNSDRWHANRVAFMESQFAKGMHPDTHKDFWSGYAEIKKPPFPRRPRTLSLLLMYGPIVLVGIAGISITLAGAIWLRRRRLAQGY